MGTPPSNVQATAILSTNACPSYGRIRCPHDVQATGLFVRGMSQLEHGGCPHNVQATVVGTRHPPSKRGVSLQSLPEPYPSPLKWVTRPAAGGMNALPLLPKGGPMPARVMCRGCEISEISEIRRQA